MKLVIATSNTHKLSEIRAMLSDHRGIELLSLSDFPHVAMPPETGATMHENARIKAVALAEATGLTALADDSGIEVDALHGAPGVHSARWVPGTDAQRTRALLETMEPIGQQSRSARYRCAICLAWPAGGGMSLQEVEATCEGHIAHYPRGDNGFGYDPIFEITAATGAPQEYIGCTMAQVPASVKAAISHRARAIAALQLQW